MIYEAEVKDEREKDKNLRNKGPDGIKEGYNFIQANNRSNKVQIHELVVNGCKVSDERQMVKATVALWATLIDEEPVTLLIGEYDLKIEVEIMYEEIEVF
ncbi:hypothetical protein FHG87_021130 [Trinorchestia longiramus]|nr:hypothetical protein FHG87_021130 [Trinorchestia longiramus]